MGVNQACGEGEVEESMCVDLDWVMHEEWNGMAEKINR